MPITSKDQLLSANVKARKVASVEVPEWGDTVYIRTISARERDAFEASIIGKGDGDRDIRNMRAKFAVLVLSDADGNRLFTDSDAESLGEQLSAKALDRVFDAATAHNGMKAEKVTEAEGN